MTNGFGDTPNTPPPGADYPQQPTAYPQQPPPQQPYPQQPTDMGYPAVGQPAYPGAPGAGYNPWDSVEYAGFFQRFLAVFIDGLVAWLFLLPAIIVASVWLVPSFDCVTTESNFSTELGINTSRTTTCENTNLPAFLTVAALGLGGSIAYLVFWCKRIGETGQSPGKKAMGVRVIDATTGQAIGTGRAFGRYLCYSISAFVCYLGYFWALWDPRHQAWHDKIVGTVVIKSD
ncbi:MAG: RDD family protein [Acidimicrobiia bacterium]|nr:RDD family protein [Acidimicrobiia bacterium]